MNVDWSDYYWVSATEQAEHGSMRDREYIAHLKDHLADFRVRELGIDEQGYWGSPPRPYAHILPWRHREQNIVAAIREQFWPVQAKQQWSLHRYFHHLSSSQALAFNLFFAAYPELPSTFLAFRRVLQLDPMSPYSVDFEVVLDDQEGTNIDVLVTGASGLRTIIEIKLTEQTFGRAKADQRHLEKLRNVYRPLLTDRISEECFEPTAFLKDYQLFRNVAQIRRGAEDRVVFLIPRTRATLWAHANKWSQSPRLGAIRRNVTVVATEDMIEALLEDSVSPNMPAGLAAQVSGKYSLANNGWKPAASGIRKSLRGLTPRR